MLDDEYIMLSGFKTRLRMILTTISLTLGGLFMISETLPFIDKIPHDGILIALLTGLTGHIRSSSGRSSEDVTLPVSTNPFCKES